METEHLDARQPASPVRRRPGPRRPVRAGATRLLLACAAVCLLGASAAVGLAAAASAGHPLSKSSYDAQLSAIGVRFAGDLNVALADTTSARLAATRVGKLSRELAGIAATLRSISPPPGIRREHARLIVAVAEFERELGPIVASLRRGALTLYGSIPALKGLSDVQRAVKAIDAAGYSIGG